MVCSDVTKGVTPISEESRVAYGSASPVYNWSNLTYSNQVAPNLLLIPFIEKDKSILITVKIDFPSKKDQEKTLSEGLFLND